MRLRVVLITKQFRGQLSELRAHFASFFGGITDYRRHGGAGRDRLADGGGKAPFRGSPTEVMYQHQHASLPIEQLKDVPQPVALLLEMLLGRSISRHY